jgi:hypothetical protein
MSGREMEFVIIYLFVFDLFNASREYALNDNLQAGINLLLLSRMFLRPQVNISVNGFRCTKPED